MEKIVDHIDRVYQWVTVHERHQMRISSYYLETPKTGVLIDPRIPEEGLEWFGSHARPSDAVLTNRHHYRDCGRFAETFGATVWCEESGLHEFSQGQAVRGFRFGDRLPGGIEAHEVDAICSEEAALFLPQAWAVALADGVVRDRFEGELTFVPDFLLGDDPVGVRRSLLAAFERLLRLDFDTLLLAHGLPLVGDGKERLRAFVETRDPDEAGAPLP
jgi:hypothetical protein